MGGKDEIKRFEAALGTDRELRHRFEESVQEIARSDRTRRAAEIAAMAAAQLGYSLPVDCFESAAAMEAISDDEIGTVAGGRAMPADEFHLNTWLGTLLRDVMKKDSARFAEDSGAKKKPFAAPWRNI